MQSQMFSTSLLLYIIHKLHGANNIEKLLLLEGNSVFNNFLLIYSFIKPNKRVATNNYPF